MERLRIKELANEVLVHEMCTTHGRDDEPAKKITNTNHQNMALNWQLVSR
jgi:hypothetical protein